MAHGALVPHSEEVGDDRHNIGTSHAAPTVSCVECESASSLSWRGWQAHRVDNPLSGEPPALAFFCPACAAREFGSRAQGRRREAG